MQKTFAPFPKTARIKMAKIKENLENFWNHYGFEATIQENGNPLVAFLPSLN